VVDESRLRLIEEEIRSLQERNKRVETDKAWEVSGFRIFSIAALIYIVAGLFLLSIGNAEFILNGLVPPIGYVLSMQTLPMVKRWWTARHRWRNARS
jgi:hypothetical protein